MSLQCGKEQADSFNLPSLFKKKIKLSTDGILHFDVKRTYLVNYIEMALGSREVFIALYCCLLYTSDAADDIGQV